MKENKALVITTIWIVIVSIFLYSVLAKTFDAEGTPQFIKNNENGVITKSENKTVIKYKVEDGQGNYLYSWTFHKNEDTEEKIEDQVDFLIETDVVNPKIEKLTDVEDKLVVTFSHHGNLPSTSTIELDVSEHYADGEKLYLYYFNEDENIIEYKDSNIVVQNGYADFNIKHCSEYILTKNKIENAEGNPIIAKGVLFYIMIMVIIGTTLKNILFNGK